jgi:hypothetical protein
VLGLELGVLFLEGVGDVLEEDEAEHDVLVLGRVHAAAQGVGGLPELGLEAEVGGGVVLGGHVLPLYLRHALPRMWYWGVASLGAPNY